jgi:hypothetical protein
VLSVQRKDSLTWIRAEALDGKTGTFGSYQPAGRHLWSLAGGLERGRHAVSATFAERGAAASLLGTEEESASGQGTLLQYRYRSPKLTVNASGGRAFDHRESFAAFVEDSKRDASALTGAATVEHANGLSARLDYRREHVSRTVSEEFDKRAESWWGSLGWHADAPDTGLSVEVGIGRHGALDRYEWAPSASYRVRGPGWRSRLGLSRVIHAEWSDLGLDQSPFLQSTWAAVVELDLGETRARSFDVQFFAGRTTDRAIITRTPITDIALRLGATADPDAYGFGLWTGRLRQEWSRYAIGGEGFLLARSSGLAQPEVDPGWSATGYLEGRFAAFQSDLGITVRAGVAAVGARKSEAEADFVLPDYLISDLTARLTLLDAIFTFRVRNLEDERHEEPWIDSATGLEAIGPGREWRFAFTLLLKN